MISGFSATVLPEYGIAKNTEFYIQYGIEKGIPQNPAGIPLGTAPYIQLLVRLSNITIPDIPVRQIVGLNIPPPFQPCKGGFTTQYTAQNQDNFALQ